MVTSDSGKSKLYMPDIIISDVMMPEKDGIEMVRELREEMTTSHIPHRYADG